METRGIIRHIDRSVPRELRGVLRLAKDNGWWVYHRPAKKWYSPDEFEEVAHQLLQRMPNGGTNSGDFFAENPWDGLRLRIDHLLKVSNEVASFAQRLEEYHRHHKIFR